MTPEMADSIGNGTRISPARVWLVGTGSLTAPAWNCQMPLRLSQLERTNCGRGYSGSGLSVSTWLAQGVIKGACFICQAWALVAATRAKTKGNTRFLMRIRSFIALFSHTVKPSAPLLQVA